MRQPWSARAEAFGKPKELEAFACAASADVKAGCTFRQCGGRESEGNQCSAFFIFWFLYGQLEKLLESR